MLIAVGLGTGDPELLTLKAVRLLREADAVFVPGKLAHRLVKQHRPDATLLEFPMTDDDGHIQKCLERNAMMMAPVAVEGLAVFGIIGDPNLFSTFSRVCEVISREHPDVEFGTVPGITSVTAFASAAKIPISSGFIVDDGNGVNGIVRLKVTAPAAEARRMRVEGYREFVLVERISMNDEKVYSGDNLPEKSNYFSVLYARR